MNVPLQIERNEDSGAHDDLLLTVASYEHRADSYYFGIDRSPTAPSTIEGALARLLDQWLVDLAGLGVGGVVFLPFDFSDQCTAWLRVTRLGSDQVRVELGWTSVEGWSFVPSNYLGAAGKIRDFEPIDEASFDAPRADLVTAVATMRDGFRAAYNKRSST